MNTASSHAAEHLGQCACGTVSFILCLPTDLAQLAPRACDCDFCTTRQIAWLSHPKGKLIISSREALLKVRQGSEQAEFLTCPNCNSVVAAALSPELSSALESKSDTLAAVNATLLNEHKRLATAVVASPKLLSPEEKNQRWQQVWMPLTFAPVDL